MRRRISLIGLGVSALILGVSIGSHSSSPAVAARKIGVFPRGVRPVAGPTVSPVTISMDGRAIEVTGNDLAVRELATGKSTPLSIGKSNAEERPDSGRNIISADGTMAAFVWRKSPRAWELRIAGTDGKGMKTLRQIEASEYFTPIAIHPASGRILALTGRLDGRELQSISLRDGSMKSVKKLPGFFPAGYALSGDGRFLAYHARPQAVGTLAIFVEDLQKGSGQVLLKAPGENSYPLWAADGSTLYFLSDRSGKDALWAVSIAEGRATGEPRMISTEWPYFTPLGITKSGQIFCDVKTSFIYHELADLDSKTGQLRGKPSKLPSRFPGMTHAGWSPDGTKLLYHSDKSLVVQTLSSGEERVVPTGLAVHPRTPWWTKGGQSVIIQASGPDGKEGIYELDLATGSTSQLVAIQDDDTILHFAGLSPDGRSFYYSQSGKGIIRRDSTKGQETVLLPMTERTYVTPELSPDGKSIAYLQLDVSPSGRSTEIRIIPVEGGTSKLLLNRENIGNTLAGEVIWTPDGTGLYITRRKEPAEARLYEIMRLDIATGKIQPTGVQGEGLRFMSIRPDGGRISYAVGYNNFDLWVIEGGN